jgi:tight adherence protein C
MDVLFLVLLITAVSAFFIGMAVLLANIAVAGMGRAGVARSLHSITTVYGGTRAIERGAAPAEAESNPPVSNRMTRLGRVATPGTALARLRRWLDYAGNPPYWTVDRVFEIKGLGLIGVGLLGAVLGLALNGVAGMLIGGLAGAVVGYFTPDVVVFDLSQRRQDNVRRTLPDILDTLTVSVEAGLGFDAALAQITRYGRGPVAGEFARVLQEMQIGRSRVDALRALSQRTSVTELKSFCAIVVQATELGVPIANVMREQSREMRVRRRQRAEELAQKIPIKILFPLIFCLFPAIFIVVLGPGIINIMRLFGS